jgi:hypothetical protein
MKKVLFIACAGMSLASCSSNRGYISDSNAQLQLKRDDLELTAQISTEVKQTLIFGIDFKRLFKSDMGTIRNYGSPAVTTRIPILGSIFSDGTGKLQGYAVAKLMADNPTYDCVVYPRYAQKTKNIIWIVKKSTGKLECRLGKIK